MNFHVHNWCFSVVLRQFMGLVASLRRSARDYNVFDTNSTDPAIVRQERWSTRLYICLLSLAMLVLLFYTVLYVNSSEWKIKNPSLDAYLKLSQSYQNIECPCSQIAVPYKTVLQLEATYHPICSSDFVSGRWIEFLFDNTRTTSRYAADFRATASQQFQVLRELCQLAIAAVQNGLETLSNDQLISGQLLSEKIFKAKLEADILAFQRITTANFWGELTLVRSLIFGNQLMPAIETAFTIIVRSDTPGVIRSS